MFTSVWSCRAEVEQAGEEGSLANGGVKPGEGETEQGRPTLTFLTRSPAAHPPSPATHALARSGCQPMQRILIIAEHISIHLLDEQIIFEIDVVIVTGTSKLR